ncbi:MAG: sugar ABC transporter ATP-binding protein [Mesorhizobium sp.]|nr:sugar ABC transporter ATP-binding protein [Mesorhizobium sp.]MBL8579053.1 sugar ABC transporter ATP-binding protein [Mesorhizobium sp.]
MPHLAVRNIAKSYDGNPAVRDISFAVAQGRVLALCGENGAGKSTLMKTLSGATLPDAGDILLEGKSAAIRTPADAMDLGIRIVYQELSLLPHISVAENILLGRLPTRGLSFVVDWPKANGIAAGVLSDLGFPDIDPTALAGSLSVARQQIVEIAKALATEPQILILDEPTAVLSAAETDKLFDKVRKLAAAGTTVLYISHRLEEIYAIADEIVVLKDGRSVLSGEASQLDQATLIQAMVGRSLSAVFPVRRGAAGHPILQVENLSLAGHFRDVSFDVRAGEIVGMFGLVGSGRTEIAKAIFGARPADHGTVRLGGKSEKFATPAEAVRGRVAMVTEDRKGDGLALDASVIDNAGLASFSRYAPSGIINGEKRRTLVDEKIRELSIKLADPSQPVRQLSGGNQQKVVLAKWLLVEDIQLFIFDEPTRGVDIATKVEIYQMIRDLADGGMAVLMISSEMPEVLGMADRLLVVRDGSIVAELQPTDFQPETVFAHAAGLDAAQATMGRPN